jgi:hypothetical protein
MMGFWKRNKKPALSHAAMLASIPTPHPDITAKPLDDGKIELALPAERSKIGKWLARGDDSPIIRRFELDSLGADAWRLIDGRRSVQQMIEQFAEQQQLNLREAEVAMLRYLRTLAGRGIMMLALAEPNDASA